MISCSLTLQYNEKERMLADLFGCFRQDGGDKILSNCDAHHFLFSCLASQGASSYSSAASCTSSLSDLPNEDFHEAVNVISDGESLTPSLLDQARSILSWLGTQPNRSFAIPPDLIKDADIRNLLIAMLEYSLNLDDHAQRYAASSIICCEQNVEALGKLANMWLGYFLLPCMSLLPILSSIANNPSSRSK
jgi:hypothetical protein